MVVAQLTYLASIAHMYMFVVCVYVCVARVGTRWTGSVRIRGTRVEPDFVVGKGGRAGAEDEVEAGAEAEGVGLGFVEVDELG